MLLSGVPMLLLLLLPLSSVLLLARRERSRSGRMHLPTRVPRRRVAVVLPVLFVLLFREQERLQERLQNRQSVLMWEQELARLRRWDQGVPESPVVLGPRLRWWRLRRPCLRGVGLVGVFPRLVNGLDGVH